MKAIKILGRAIPLPVLIGILAASAMGATVAYFSVFTISDVQVEDWYTINSYAVMRWDGSDWVEIDPSTDVIYGGDTIRVYYNLANDANNDVTAKHRLIITESTGPASSSDIDAIQFKYDANPEEDVKGSEAVSGDTLTYESSEYTHPALNSADAYFEITFNPFFEPQTLSFEVQVAP